MEICFLRHGIAGEPGPAHPDDRLRPLTAEGEEKMRSEAPALARLFHADLIVTSPLTRARQTAAIAAEAYPRVTLKVLETLAWAPMPALCESLNLLGVERVMAVGHEVHLSLAVSYLIAGDEEAGILVKKGAAALVACASAGAGTGQLQWLIQPAALRAIGRLSPR